tara:strand:+ start:409 stop:630 length:222 start_codon:yes stop_codon:yes gene_type:complete
MSLGVVLAACFRSASGSLPPYTVEYFPSLFKQFCLVACGSDEKLILESVNLAMLLREDGGELELNDNKDKKGE